MNENESELKELLKKNDEISLKLKESRENINKLSKELHNLEGKKEVLFRLLNKGTRAILQAKKNGKLLGIHGLVSQLGKANEEYSKPLKIAAGKRSNSIVVDDVNSAKAAIEYLKKNKLGYATFLPLNKISGRQINKNLEDKKGVVGYAIDLIEYNKEYENIFRYVFSDTLIVENIDTAKKFGIKRNRMVTLEGELIERSGSITGGHRKDKSIGFKSETIDEQINKIKNKLDEKRIEIQTLAEKEDALQEKISDLRNNIYHLNNSIESIEDFKQEKFEQVKNKLEAKKSKLAELNEKLKNLPEKVDEEKINEINKNVENLQEKLNNKKAEKQGIELELNVMKRDIERSENILKDLDKENKNFTKKIKEDKNKLENFEKKLENKLKEEQKFHSELKDLYKKRNELNDKNKELEISKTKFNEKINNIQNEINNLKLEIAEINAKLEGKKTAMEEFSDVQIPDEIKRSVKEIEEEIKYLEIKISNFGAVNMRALEAYKEVEKEHKKLKDKYTNLEDEKNEVLSLIDEIETKKEESFMESYKNVADNFERIFSTLSPGGEAKLILENEEDVFEGGIDIFARHRGKKFISLRAMSGGEKTITTLAFIFAIQEYQPSPFYILDEVDAALDKENSEMLGRLLNEYSKKSQFIVITHNDSVLSQADNIYGVHLNKLGESQIVSVKLPEK